MGLLRFAFGLCGGVTNAWGHGPSGVWDVGVFPNLSPVALVKLYAPLRNYLSEGMHAPVRLYTAPNFSAYIEALQAGRYEIAVVPPHLAWFAVKRCGYVSFARYTARIRGVVVVRKGSALHSLASLRGRRIAFPDPLALMTQVIEGALADEGLHAGKNYQIVMAQSHNNAALMVVRGEAAAAGMGYIPLRSLPGNVADALRVIYTTPPLAPQYLLIKASEPAALRHRLLANLLAFAATPAGRSFFKHGGLGGIEPATDAGLAAYRKYLPVSLARAP